VLAAAQARCIHAPNLVPVFEFGGAGASLERLSLTAGSENSFHQALAASGICNIAEAAQRGMIEFGVLGAAQIDPYGNLNTTAIGDHDHQRVRLPGAGGGNDVASHCWRTIVMMRQDKQKFVASLDFLSSPGYLDGPGAREKAGLPAGTGPYRVITDLAILGYNQVTKRMLLLATQPGVSIEQVVENTGFHLGIASQVNEIPPPTAEELRVLREEVDRDRLYI